MKNDPLEILVETDKEAAKRILTERIESSFKEGVRLGFVKRAGMKDGKPAYKLTKRGKKYVESNFQVTN